MGKGLVNPSLAEQVSGRKAPHKFPTLDASVLEYEAAHKVIRENVKMNMIVFEFPSGFNKLDLFEECRALTMLDDFQAMYDITTQMLVNKDIIIKLRNEDGSLTTLESIHVTDRFQDLRGYDTIDKFPIIITWLTEFIATELLKKYPLPGKETPPAQVTEKSPKTEKKTGSNQSSIK